MSSYSAPGVQVTDTARSLVRPGGAPPGHSAHSVDRMHVEPWLERAAALRPDVIAVEADDGALSYAELLARARAGAAGLAADRVAIAPPAGLEFAVALHACLLAGAAAVPVDLREPKPRLAGSGL